MEGRCCGGARGARAWKFALAIEVFPMVSSTPKRTISCPFMPLLTELALAWSGLGGPDPKPPRSVLRSSFLRGSDRTISLIELRLPLALGPGGGDAVWLATPLRVGICDCGPSLERRSRAAGGRPVRGASFALLLNRNDMAATRWRWEGGVRV